jgi:hypothetical protein
MTKQLQIGDQIVIYDRERTEKAYAGIKAGDADRCSYYRNFAAQRSAAYPENFGRLLNQLGIDVDKEGEVYECGSNGSLWLYGRWFYLSGENSWPTH